MRYALSYLLVGLSLFGVSAVRGADTDKNSELPLEVLRSFKPGKGITQGAALSSDEKILAAGTRETDTLYLYDVETGKELTLCKLDHACSSYNCAFTPDGKSIFWEDSEAGVVRQFDTSNGKLVRQFSYRKVSPKKALHTAQGSTFSASCKLFVVASSPIGTNSVELWDVEKGKLIRQLPHGFPNSVAISADEKMIATQDMFGEVRVWDMKGKLLHTFERPGQTRKAAAAMTMVVFSPDGKHLATGSHLEQTVRVWNLETKKIVHEISLAGTNGIPGAVLFTPDSKWVGVSTVVRTTSTLQFYEVASGAKMGYLNSEGQFDQKVILFGTKNGYLTGGGGDGVRLYGPSKGREKDLPFFVPAPSTEIKPKD